jgi:glutamate dehydrogenase
VRCLDGEDPYLVVAADKGTATFSDIANKIAAEHNFWLGDAFASGGSAGYDHKALAITARGAWVAVAHHFAQIGIDVQTDRITAVGVGDMSGDVFGNGMLSSPTIALVAAFDHRHIFIDPNPDLAVSLAQRQRLFELPRSSWADYDTDTLSPGGAIYPRSAKRIELSAQACAALGVDVAQSSRTPDEVMSAILAAPVDLLWNGGIGTYVKATSQDHASVGDRANDSLRINGADLKCTVVGEGGNLGFTQLGRIEAALAGVRLNTDAIDNSGGVDCSDREVNLKILLALLESDGSLTRDERDRWLEADADAVCQLVLDTNREQNALLTLAEANAQGMVDVHARLLDWLGTAAGLDRHLEALPSNADLAERGHGGRGLTRPELAVVLAYVKNLLAVELSGPAPEGTPLSSDRVTLATLEAYVPPGIAARTGSLIERHPLREPLLATMVANMVVNRGGISMVRRLVEETSASVHDVAKAHLAAWSIFDLETRRNAIDALDGIVEPEVQLRMKSEVKRLAERATRWLLRHERQPIDVGHILERYRGPIADLYSMIADARQSARASVAFQLATVGDDGAGGLDDDIAEYDRAFGFLDLVDVAERTGASLGAVAAMSTAVEFELGLNHLRQRVVDLPRGDHWETLARGALRDEFYREHAEITAAALTSAALVASGRSGSPEHSGLEPWRRDHQAAIARFSATLAEIDSAGRWDLAGASVAMRAMAVLGRSAARHITPVRPAPSTDRAAGAS